MKIALQLAYKNLIGGGLKTWLSVSILAFTYLLIVFFNGFMDGWNYQAVKETMAWETGEGQLRHEDYDPLDLFSVSEGHGRISEEHSGLVPILVRQGAIYPEQRMIPILLKGIDIEQEALLIPTAAIRNSDADMPVVIGDKFANSNGLSVGDEVTMRWRDEKGTFDASTITIASVFETNISGVDAGQIWMSLKTLQDISGLQGEASYFVSNSDYEHKELGTWTWHSKDEMLAGLYKVIASKRMSASILYILLLAISLLALFDTQVLSIFRRQKEIGTYISLGMTRSQVVKLFTVEGVMYSVFAAIVAFVIGIPLLGLSAWKGIQIPEASRSTGVDIATVIFPRYGLFLILGTLVFVLLAAIIVSYLPSRKIARLDPVNALKGKLQ